MKVGLGCLQIITTYTRQFWPAELFDVVHPGGFAPEFWMLRRPTTAPGEVRHRRGLCMPTLCVV